jgi:hypothetical protein
LAAVAKILTGTINSASASALSLQEHPVLQIFTGITNVASASVLLFLKTPRFPQVWNGTPEPAHLSAPTKSARQVSISKLLQTVAIATAFLRSVMRITIGIQILAVAIVLRSPAQ